jgi:ribosome-binding factor A
MAGDRMRRVDEAMREVLSAAITSEIKDPRVGFVTVTAVRTSSDLRHCRVFVSILGDEEERQAGLEGLRSSQGFLQRRVAQAVRMKYTPEIVFSYDDSVDRGMRITELLRDLPPSERDEVIGDAARMDDSQHEEDA